MSKCSSECLGTSKDCGGGTCVDTETDPHNCGGCGIMCPSSQVCSMSTCGLVCLGGTTLCGSACKDISVDPANCGACGKACAAGESCTDSVCSAAPCSPGQTTCGTGTSQYCANIGTDPQNCGGCGFVCPAGKVCSGGQCGLTCTGKTSTLCSGSCVDTDSDNKSCGTCGNACPGGQVCSAGACAVTCVANYLTCGSGSSAYCANPYDDQQNCGTCGAVCPAGQLCSNGTCASFCGGALDTLCNGLCVNVHSDNKNCGSCANACPTGQVCSGGVCATACAAGYSSCGTGAGAHCALLPDDPQNCGTCGKACAVGQGCSLGVCGAACNGIEGTLCGGLCTNLETDPANCGSCGFSCSSGQVCSSGACTGACGANQFTCVLGTTSFCTDASVDPANCGGCGQACTGGKICSNGMCGTSCQAGFDTCGVAPSTFCTHIQSDPNNCGGCGKACAPPIHGAATSCTFGACGYTCNPGYAAVNNNNACLTLTGISAGRYHTCGLTAAGGVMCWGFNADGELGDGTLNTSYTPVTVLGLAGPVTKVVAGNQSTCAILASGGVQCWGYNGYGQLGNGTMGVSGNAAADSRTPVNVKNISGVVDVQSGHFFNCALTSSGSVQCWGYNGSGQLGNNTTVSSSVPVVVQGLSFGAVAITAAKTDPQGLGQHVCAITTAGVPLCWGYNGYGQLGNNTTTNSAIPVGVLGLSSGIVSIAAGAVHTCVLTNTGAVDCWGHNAEGELGNGTIGGGSLTYGPVVGVSSGVVALAAGGYHTCALTATQTTLCWGYNAYGQLGDGTTSNRSTPVPLVLPMGMALTGIVSLGTVDSFGTTTAGPLLGWGYQADFGELGDGTVVNRTAPTPIK